MKSEMTLRELSEELGEEKRIRLLCEDENIIVLTFSKKQSPLSDEYDFDMGM